MLNLPEQDVAALAGSARNGYIAWHALRDPDAVALLAPGRPPLCYAALVSAAARCAKALAAAGFGRGDRIVVALPNGPEAALALLAVADCATCVPLNPVQDDAAAECTLRLARVDAVIVPGTGDSAVARVAEMLGVPVLRVSFRAEDPAGCFDLAADRPRAPRVVEPVRRDDIAFLFQTSGTTSRPKAVPITHLLLAQSLLRELTLFGMSAADRCLNVTPMFTNSFVRRGLYSPLIAGGSVVCTPGFDVRTFPSLSREFAPTFYSAGPAVHIALLAALEREGFEAAKSLRFVWSGATALAPDVQERLERALGVPVIQGYGMGEAGTVACNPMPPGRRKPGSVGPAVGTEIEVRDDTRRRLPVSAIGDVWVRGDGVVGAYEENPEANRESFHDGWFRTGDLGYFDDDGYLFLAGRASEVINRGGIKVSPMEIDALLASHPGVLRAASFAVPHPTLGEDVAAAVVLRDAVALSPQALREFALAGLAGYKVPSRIVLVRALPVTAQGKLRRRELAALLASELQQEYTAPRDAREADIARIFAAVLGLARMGAHDNFFYLGGDSLRGAQAAMRISAALGIEIATTLLFRAPTPAEFAAALDVAGAEPGGAPPPIVARSRANREPPSGNTSDD